jgi:glycosyltransferase involved in cell wall biosynthesis
MRVLYLSQYFPPEIGATQTRAYEMARGLVRAGHRVTVIAEVPNHPSGIISAEYRGKFFTRSQLDGIDVIRVWVKASPVKTFARRMEFYLSYMLMAILAGLFLVRGKYDVIYTTSPPLFVGAAGLAISYLRRIPFVFEARDLWPESAVALRELRHRRAVQLAEWLATCCYRRARRVVVVTSGIQQSLLARGVPAASIRFIPNGANTDRFAPGPIDFSLRQKLQIAAPAFVVIYTGLHGLVHGMDVILQAAELFLQRRVDEQRVCFLLIGDGVAKPQLEFAARKNGLTNVRFLAPQAEADLPPFIRLANAGLATTAKLPLTQGTLPVKMFSYLACARPVLLAVDGEAKELIEKAKAGLCIPPEDPAALVQAIEQLRNDSELCRRLGANGRDYVTKHYSRQAQAGQLVQLLEEVVNDNSIIKRRARS